MSDVSAPLPQLDLPPQTVIRVTVTGGGTLTGFAIHGWQDTDDTTTVSTLDPLLAHDATTAALASGSP